MTLGLLGTAESFNEWSYRKGKEANRMDGTPKRPSKDGLIPTEELLLQLSGSCSIVANKKKGRWTSAKFYYIFFIL